MSMRETLNQLMLVKLDTIKGLATVLVGSLFLALCSQVVLTLPFTPVPLTFQTFGVMLLGYYLGARKGAAACLLYLLQGGLGLPFFAGATAGWAVLGGATAGYLLSFPLASAFVGFFREHTKGSVLKLGVLFSLGHLLVMFSGWSVLAVLFSPAQAWYLGVLPFLPGMVIKVVVLTGIARATRL